MALSHPGMAATREPRVMALRSDGVLLGAEGYAGEPAVIVRWCEEPEELARRIGQALDLPAVSGIRIRSA
jgi:hypothetical protein